MKRLVTVVMVMLAIAPVLISGNKIKNAPAPAESGEQIHWLSIDELQEKMKMEPRKVYVDVYTGWCGWCKKMEASTFQNKSLIKYMNNNFYAVRLDAETKDTIDFMGKKYFFNPANRANTFAVELLKGQMSYPTSVLMLENFQSPTPIPGYHAVGEMESFLRYFGDNLYKHQTWTDFQKTFKSAWDNGEKPDMTPPAGH